jgi:threonine dehydrogenase-like Zn-dependent dehydrogenase
MALRCQNQNVSVEDVPRLAADGEALVRVTLSGICNTDLEIARGYAGFQGTLGHESVGVVEELLEDHSSGLTSHDSTRPSLTVGLLTPGQRVVAEINAGCGRCDLCRSGDSRHCPNRTVLGIVGRDGAHAEFLKLPRVNLLPVPDEVSDEQAVFLNRWRRLWNSRAGHDYARHERRRNRRRKARLIMCAGFGNYRCSGDVDR